MAPKWIELSGQQFGRWLVKSLAHKKGAFSFWDCQCECGVSRIVAGGSLRNGNSKSCGCLARELSAEEHSTHKLSKTKIYECWAQMLSRCKNPSHRSYKYYGKKGIRVCQRWHIFENFYEDMGPSWKDRLTIERVNNDKDYKPSNCAWVTKGEQAKNRRTNVFVETPWGLMIVADAARKMNMSPTSFARRMKNWPKEKWFIKTKPYRISVTSNP